MKTTFIEQYVRHLLAEQIGEAEIISIAETVGKIISSRFRMERVLLLRDALGSQSTVALSDETGSDLGPVGDIWAQGSVIKNYKLFFGEDPEGYSHNEILKFEFSGYNWLYVNLAYTEDGKKFVTMSFSPDLNDMGIIRQIGKALKSDGYQLFSKPDQVPEQGGHDEDFLDRLVSLFRHASGRYYHSGMFNQIKPKLDKLKEDMPEMWRAWQDWIREKYPSGVVAYRVLALEDDSSVELVGGGERLVRDLQTGDRFYYHPGGRAFSQWTESPSRQDVASGISVGYGRELMLKSTVRPEKVVYTNKVMPAGFAPHNVEQEIIVSHPDSNATDKDVEVEVVEA